MKLQILLKTSILKTIRFNLKYFSFRSIFKPKVLIARNVKLSRLKGKVIIPKKSFGHIGFSTNPLYKGKKSKTLFFNDGIIEIRGHFCISEGTSISILKDARLTIGDNVHISQMVQIECHKEIFIGNETIIGWDTLIMDSDSHSIIENGVVINQNCKIVIEDNCWICCRCMLLKGAVLPFGSVLAAGSIYTKNNNTFNNSIYVNNKCVRENIEISIEEAK